MRARNSSSRVVRAPYSKRGMKMICIGTLPRVQRMCRWISAARSRADWRSWPKGFSTTTRAFFVSPAMESPPITIANNDGGTSR